MARILLNILRAGRRFRKAREGAAAIEFAIVAFPFFAMIFMIIEVMLAFFFQQVLETAAADASRLIMTGQVQAANMTAGEFQTQVCNRLPPLFDCTEGSVSVDVRTFASFGAATVTPLEPGGQTLYQPGAGGQIVIVRVSYAMPVFTNFYGGLGNLEGNKLLLMATSAFRNEPFLGGAGAGAGT